MLPPALSLHVVRAVVPTSGEVSVNRYLVDVVQDVSAVHVGASHREAFERIWALLPEDHPRRRWRFLDQDGGLFIKGSRVPWSPSWRAMRLGRRLLGERRRLAVINERGLPFPRLVAYGEERDRGVITRAFLVLRQLAGVVDFEQFLQLGETEAGCLEQKAEQAARAARAVRQGRKQGRMAESAGQAVDGPLRALTLEAVGHAVRRLHEARVFHRDLAPRNVMLRFGEGGLAPEVFFIDCPSALIDPSETATRSIRRAELFRLTRGICRMGASEDEARVLLAAAGAEYGESILELVELQGTSRRRPRQVDLWYLTGWKSGSRRSPDGGRSQETGAGAG
jgi:hypothetical protein